MCHYIFREIYAFNVKVFGQSLMILIIRAYLVLIDFSLIPEVVKSTILKLMLSFGSRPFNFDRWIQPLPRRKYLHLYFGLHATYYDKKKQFTFSFGVDLPQNQFKLCDVENVLLFRSF